MKTIGYIRVSTEEQAREGLSLEAQEQRIRAYCAAYDMELVLLLRDNGKSAKNLSGRPGMQALISAARARECEAVICYKLDRMFRSVRDGVETLDLFARNDIAFISVVEQWNTTTAAGRFAVNMILALAQLEREQTAERTRDVLRATKQSKGGSPILDSRRKSGKLVVGQAPFGFYWRDPGTPNSELVVQESEMTIVREIYRLAKEGKPSDAIAVHLGEMGAVQRRGARFHPRAIRRILAKDARATYRGYL